jgi:hypothetical protein
MALVDWEALVLDLEAHVRSKNSHGQRELLDLLADLRSRHRVSEGLPERAGRLYLPELLEELSGRPALPEDVDSREMASSSPHRNGS